jgi:regulator of protease activity HflC (stomatin/prohibitin superfamily)
MEGMKMTMLDTLLGRTRVLVKENERAIALYKGEIINVLVPGEHIMPNRQNHLEIERHDLVRPELVSKFDNALLNRHAALAAKHVTTFRAGADELVLIDRDGQLHAVLLPERKLTVWNDAGPWVAQTVSIKDTLAVDLALMRRVGGVRLASHMHVHVVNEGQAGLLYIDGKLAQVLAPSTHAYWNVGRVIKVTVVDLRVQSLDVTGQELLTRDRVSIRINIAAEYQVVDPAKAEGLTKDYTDTLHRALQMAFRKTLGALTLDQILERKGVVDVEAGEKVRGEMAALGVKVLDIALKDVILPGEMREILNQVVAAEKQAEANVIRRREETNATRSLLNTAKVMSENPVMLRLKELEALESIASKVDKLTIHNGTSGLMNDLVKLAD